ncbi:MAG TPA: mannosyltransferase family protein [Anaerolineales bacterium]
MRDFFARFQRFFEVPGASPRWFWDSVLFPFLLTRLVWLLVGYYAYGNYVTNPSYEKYYKQGFFLTKYFFLDMFARWDARWYLSIIRDGYQPSADLTQFYSNLAFFPLYPYLVKSIGWLGLNLPAAFYILVGLLLSNLLFLLAMALLYRLIVLELGFEPAAAARALGLIFVFPAGFFFASFYTESLFLFLALLGFTFALRGNWLGAGIAAALGVLTRSQGVALLVALLWLYMEMRGWRLREVRPSLGWFALGPLALGAHFYSLYLISGRPLAMFEAMSAWGRISEYNLGDPFRNLAGPSLDVFKIDLVLFLLFLASSLYILWKWKWKAFGVFALLMCFLPVYTGLLVSVSRYLAIVFPVFILLGEKLKGRNAYLALMAVWYALQVVYFAGFVNYYWIA